MRRLPRGSHLKCFTTLVRYTRLRSIPACSSARSSSFPAGPTNGWPARSSASPGCSPTSISSARDGPSPKTVRVPTLYRSHALQCFAIFLTAARVGRSGSKSGTGVPGLTSSLSSGPFDMFLHHRVLTGRCVMLSQRTDRVRISGVGDGDRKIPAQPPHAGTLHRATPQQRAQLIIGPLPQIEQRGCIETVTRKPRGILAATGGWREVPGADFLADVAAIGVRTNRRPVLDRDRTLQLDREVRQAAPGVEDIRPDERPCRARFDAQGALAALIERRPVRRKGKVADDLGEEQPGAMLLVDQAGVLADPSQAGILREDALLHRTGIDVCLRYRS